MVEIHLKKYYYWYITDEFIEVSDEVAAELRAGKRMAARRMRLFEFGRYPTYRRAYIRAFERALEERAARGKIDNSWRAGTTGEDVFRWWMQDRNIEG